VEGRWSSSGSAERANSISYMRKRSGLLQLAAPQLAPVAPDRLRRTPAARGPDGLPCDDWVIDRDDVDIMSVDD
jgi:hypothetical protein